MRLMSGREAIDELSGLIEVSARQTISLANMKTDLDEFKTRLDRTRFLIDYVHGKLPRDTDKGCCT